MHFVVEDERCHLSVLAGLAAWMLTPDKASYGGVSRPEGSASRLHSMICRGRNGSAAIAWGRLFKKWLHPGGLKAPLAILGSLASPTLDCLSVEAQRT